jgi:predicted lipoprotein with Yx(FWY)xxD motif
VLRLLAIMALMAAVECVAASPSTTTAPGGITLRPAGHGWLLADARGMTLYTYTQDQKFGPPSCVAKCAEAWPPLLAEASGRESGEWTLVARDAGARQWAFRSKPLYLSKRDTAPGEMNGDELQSLPLRRLAF